MIRIRHFLLVLVALLVSWTSWAQATFTADAPALTALGQPFRVEFVVDAEPDEGTFKAPSFGNFDVLAGPSVSTGQSVQFINGKQSSSFTRTYTYVLMPTSAGTFTIGVASIAVGGKTLQTQSLLIEVVAEKGSSGSNNGGTSSNPENSVAKDDVLLVLQVSDNDLYQGESLRATLMLYTRATIDGIDNLTMPSFDGFWSQDVSTSVTPSRETYNGRVYETYKISEWLLSPQKSGKLVIPEAVMTVGIQVVVEDDRYDIMFGSQRVYRISREIKSSPVTINVKEFPEGAPASFEGAVGNFSLSSTMPEVEIDANSADQIEITISGAGNFKFISAPHIAFPESFEVYDTKVSDNYKLASAGTSGSITYTYPFVARSAGTFTIPSAEFTYFDPLTTSYKTLKTEPCTIVVNDDGSVDVASPMSGGYSNYGGTMRQLDHDIRHIYTKKLPHKAVPAFILTPLYWLAVVLIVSLFIVSFVVLRKRIRERNNTVARRMRHADKVAVQRLRMAERYMKAEDRHAFYEEMLRAMWGYIGDKFNIPVSGLTKEKIREELYRRNVDETTVEQFCEIISRSEEAQYAPAATIEMNEVYVEAVEVISKIESVVKR